MFSRGLSTHFKDYIKQVTGITRMGGFEKYLCLTEFVGRNKSDAFSFLIQRVNQKMESWYSKLLSHAGKELLLKAMVTALPSYCMSCFLLPIKVIREISAAMRKLWWSADRDKQKIPWIAWSKIIDTKKMGRLGIRDLRDFNIAKKSWRIHQDPQSLVARVLKESTFPNLVC